MDVRDVGTLRDAPVPRADVCIVGSGPAGLTLARELTGSGRRVVILESGSVAADAWADSLNVIESDGAPRVMDQTAIRQRRLGGTSATWSGRVATFDEVDFAERPWLAGPVWPFDREELRPYFARSLPHLGLRVADNNSTQLRARVRSSSLAWDTALLREYTWSYSRDDVDRHDFLRFGPRALRDRSNAICVVRATVTQILTDPSGTRTVGVEVTAPDGRVSVIEAATVVLCAGAIENARLLLISDRVHPAGLGNGHDLVGRYLADHPRGEVGRFHPRDHATVQKLFANHLARIGGGTATLTVGVALSPVLQREEELLNGALWVSGGLAEDDGLLAALNLLRGREAGRNARHVAAGIGAILSGVKSLLVDRRSPVRRLRKLTLQAIVEQEPDRESRVTLSTVRDALGVPISRIHWKVGEREAATVRRMATVFAEELARLGHPRLELDEMIRDPRLPFFLPDVAHPSGTTRMALDPAHGVVDADSAVHGMTGLYVAGSSVFPTNGHANPTQMIVAMTVRLADHLLADAER